MKRIIIFFMPVIIFSAADKPRLLEYPQEVLSKILSYASHIKTLGQSDPKLLEKLNKYILGYEASTIDKWARFRNNISSYHIGSDHQILLSYDKTKFIDLENGYIIRVMNTNLGKNRSGFELGETLLTINLKDIIGEDFELFAFDITNIKDIMYVIAEIKGELFLYLINMYQEQIFDKINIDDMGDVYKRIDLSPDKNFVSIIDLDEEKQKIYDVKSGKMIKSEYMHDNYIFLTKEGFCTVNDGDNPSIKLENIHTNKTKILDESQIKSLKPDKKFKGIKALLSCILIAYEDEDIIILDQNNLNPIILENSIGLDPDKFSIDKNKLYCFEDKQNILKVWHADTGEIIKYINFNDIKNIPELDIEGYLISNDTTMLMLSHVEDDIVKISLIDIDNKILVKTFDVDVFEDYFVLPEITADGNTILFVANDNIYTIFSINEEINKLDK